MKILLTGFEPFGEFGINPSGELAKDFHKKTFSAADTVIEVIGKEIPLQYKEINSTIQKLILEYHPSFVIMLGQATRSAITIERVAINIANASTTAYNCGSKPYEKFVIEDAPAAYFSTLDVVKIVDIWKNHNIPAKISNTAGTFGCNQIFFSAMHYISKLNLPNGTTIEAGLIHIPLLPQQVVKKNLNVPSMSYAIMHRAISVLITEYILKRL